MSHFFRKLDHGSNFTFIGFEDQGTHRYGNNMCEIFSDFAQVSPMASKASPDKIWVFESQRQAEEHYQHDLLSPVFVRIDHKLKGGDSGFLYAALAHCRGAYERIKRRERQGELSVDEQYAQEGKRRAVGLEDLTDTSKIWHSMAFNTVGGVIITGHENPATLRSDVEILFDATGQKDAGLFAYGVKGPSKDRGLNMATAFLAMASFGYFNFGLPSIGSGGGQPMAGRYHIPDKVCNKINYAKMNGNKVEDLLPRLDPQGAQIIQSFF